MISEKEFALGFSAFWDDCIPLLTPRLVAEFNLLGSPMSKGNRDWIQPLKSKLGAADNDLVAEIAFELFAESVKRSVGVSSLATDLELIEGVTKNASQRVAGLRGRRGENIALGMPQLDEPLELALRIEQYLSLEVASSEDVVEIVVQPHFKGCGILNSCFGDILAPNLLCELKMVDRNPRSLDLRQVLIYCALNHQSRQYNIENFVILNPRRAVSYNFALDEFCVRISGKTPGDLFQTICDYLYNFESLRRPS